MERFLFSRIETWLVLLLAIVAVICAVVFGAVVLDEKDGQNTFGPVGDFAVDLAEVPGDLAELVTPDRSMEVFRDRHSDLESGWRIYGDATRDPAMGYLLLSRYDGDLARHVIELRTLPDGEILHRWTPDAGELLRGVPHTSNIADYSRWNNRHYRAIHPYLLENGDLVFKDHYSPLFQVTPCGDVVWKQDEYLFHHSTEPDGEGGFWVPSITEPSAIKQTGDKFLDDTLVRVDSTGKVIFRESLSQIMIDNGFFPMMFGAGVGTDDPLHLNDIQPVLEDGPYWKKGDLFLSMRHPSMVALFRPATGKVVWTKQGPWMGQHDVEIIDDHTIGVFNNNAYNAGTGPRVLGGSDITYYDFATDTASNIHKQATDKYNLLTFSEGLFEPIPTGHMIIEEENSGRLLILSPDGERLVEFLNRAGDGRVYRMGWSRYVGADHGDGALERIRSMNCDS